MNIDNKNNSNNENAPRPFHIGCRLTAVEKADFDQLVKILEVETPSEAIRYIIKEVLNNVS